MEFFTSISTWISQNWLGIIAAIVAFDQFLFILAPITPWTWDDTLSGKLRELVSKYLSKYIKK